jgi:hypothetical protein
MTDNQKAVLLSTKVALAPDLRLHGTAHLGFDRRLERRTSLVN